MAITDFVLNACLRGTDAYNRALVYLVEALRKTKPPGHDFIVLHWQEGGTMNYGTDLKGAALKARLQEAADKVIA